MHLQWLTSIVLAILCFKCYLNFHCLLYIYDHKSKNYLTYRVYFGIKLNFILIFISLLLQIVHNYNINVNKLGFLKNFGKIITFFPKTSGNVHSGPGMQNFGINKIWL